MATISQARQRLKQRYLERIPQKIDLLQRVVGAIQLDRHAEGLVSRMAHQLSGSAASYGFPDLGETARAVEHLDPAELRNGAERLCIALAQALESESLADSRILLVDDDPRLPQLESMLARPGRTLVPARSLREARRHVEEKRVDLVILELSLPDGDGRDFLSELRADRRFSALPVVVLSNRLVPRVRWECAAYGVHYFVAKPPDARLFPALVASALERAQSDAATPDDVTGYLSPGGFRARFDERAGTDAAVLVVDVQGLDAILATRGQAAQDRASRDIAKLVDGLIPEDAFLARQDNEFWVCLPEADLNAAMESRRAISVRTNALEIDDLPLKIDCGLALVGADQPLDEVLSRARMERQMRGVDKGWDDDTAPRDRPRILVAEDDDDTADIIKHTLEGHYDLHRVAAGDDAVRTCQDRAAFDAVLLDYDMPGLNGVEVLKALRALPAYQGTPILFLTGQRADERIAEAFAAGADDYIVKPFRDAPFLARLRRHVSRGQCQ